ncbi:1-aminocyclopropane-1-carboxylate deaminase/D-cysteine desulfhydrase [Myroides sp. WP-1]|uniref:1-aminocyclopropane-1-carboxylate deaminase/D-cysteine desulfhydrase n=1 Tax=Myroides sp. WP-1 TaxID=2759944 RepID=UPI0015FDBF2E|nr:pyridoxal-phosphate dependent enzyme [Myroides sp. WP-1]MBB1138657.1 1-aminocyclopropane-1-carboxylate deaminase/D-cysteine desulfhydrase [Myroides sp. WP-1]
MHDLFSNDIVPTEKVKLPFANGVELFIRREDLLHPEISGNKFRKLKYNMQAALQANVKQVLTFGGAYSNHIAATAAAGRLLGIETIGVIRGEEVAGVYRENPTLKKAEADGMRFKFITRTAYRNKEDLAFLAELKREFGDFYLVPEGGTNEEAVRGTEEIIQHQDVQYDYICCAVGTGGTIAGLINRSWDHQQVYGFPALKGDFLADEIKKYTQKENWTLQLAYHFGGYAKYNAELLQFIADFKQNTGILLDPIYTGKLLFGIFDLIEQNKFAQNSKILAIHTGGLQGWNEKIK